MCEFMGMAAKKRGTAGKMSTESYPELRDAIELETLRTKKLPGVKLPRERYQAGHLIEAIAWYNARNVAASTRSR